MFLKLLWFPFYSKALELVAPLGIGSTFPLLNMQVLKRNLRTWTSLTYITSIKEDNIIMTIFKLSFSWGDFFGASERDLADLRFEPFTIIKPVLFQGLLLQKSRLQLIRLLVWTKPEDFITLKTCTVKKKVRIVAVIFIDPYSTVSIKQTNNDPDSSLAVGGDSLLLFRRLLQVLIIGAGLRATELLVAHFGYHAALTRLGTAAAAATTFGGGASFDQWGGSTATPLLLRLAALAARLAVPAPASNQISWRSLFSKYKRIKTEEKAKVIASVGGEEFIKSLPR